MSAWWDRLWLFFHAVATELRPVPGRSQGDIELTLPGITKVSKAKVGLSL